MNKARMVIGVAAAVFIGGGAMGWWAARPGLDPGTGQSTAESERDILYWVAPMDPSYRRDKPGKSPMGMDLVPVYADESKAAGAAEPSLRIDPAVVNNIGVKTAPVERGTLHRRIQTVGFITPNEHLVGHVHVRSEGWIEHLAVHNEGARVEQGDVLFRFFAPAVISAQDEYVQALTSGRDSIIDATRRRLLALGLVPDQIEQLRRTREVQRLIDVKAPQSGYVAALNVRHGMFVTPELMVMSIADLSNVWVEVDVFANQVNWVASGQSARMRLPSAPDDEWAGEVEYIYPTIRAETRTARIRLAFDNPDLVLKTGMYAGVVIDAAPRHDILHVPTQAVIRTAEGERVILALGAGRFRPAEVRTGLETRGRVEIIAGLSEGEPIVVSSQFLIDSEASLDASLLRMISAGSDPGRTRQVREMPHQAERGSVRPDAGTEGTKSADHSGSLPRFQSGQTSSGNDERPSLHSGHDLQSDESSPRSVEGPS